MPLDPTRRGRGRRGCELGEEKKGGGKEVEYTASPGRRSGSVVGAERSAHYRVNVVAQRNRRRVHQWMVQGLAVEGQVRSLD
jgi:hypothetical protein